MRADGGCYSEARGFLLRMKKEGRNRCPGGLLHELGVVTNKEEPGLLC